MVCAQICHNIQVNKLGPNILQAGILVWISFAPLPSPTVLPVVNWTRYCQLHSEVLHKWSRLFCVQFDVLQPHRIQRTAHLPSLKSNNRLEYNRRERAARIWATGGVIGGRHADGEQVPGSHDEQNMCSFSHYPSSLGQLILTHSESQSVGMGTWGEFCIIEHLKVSRIVCLTFYVKDIFPCGSGNCSRCSDWLRAGWSVDRVPVGRRDFLHQSRTAVGTTQLRVGYSRR